MGAFDEALKMRFLASQIELAMAAWAYRWATLSTVVTPRRTGTPVAG
jgi:hypothetical protein